MKIICISGKSGSGKDTVASFMKTRLEENGKKVLITHFADALKYICKTFFDWNGVKDAEGRALLQRVGTDIMRSKDPDFFANFVADMLWFFGEEWDYVLIPDARFPNEIEMLRTENQNICVLRIDRPDADLPLPEEQAAHISETAMDDYDFDWRLSNDGSLKDLRVKAEAFATLI